MPAASVRFTDDSSDGRRPSVILGRHGPEPQPQTRPAQGQVRLLRRAEKLSRRPPALRLVYEGEASSEMRRMEEGWTGEKERVEEV